MKNPANAITLGRMLCAVLLVFTLPFTAGFYVLYVSCGIGDLIDGPIARRTGTAGPLGAALDSAADLVTVCAVAVRLLPTLLRVMAPGWLWAAGAAALLHGAAWLAGAVRFRRLASVHTAANRAAGLLLFFAPLSLLRPWGGVYCAAACAAAVAAGAEELVLLLTCRRFDPERRSLFIREKAALPPAEDKTKK